MKKNEILVKLSEGFSIQSKRSNQFWILLMITSIIILGKEPDNPEIYLPFSLGKVNNFDFYYICTILILVLTIVYVSAVIQAIRTRMLIQKIIDKKKNKYLIKNILHIQDFTDSILIPHYNRVAPISQFVLGKNQFFGKEEQSECKRKIGGILYIYLKIISSILFYTIPSSAVYISISFILTNTEHNYIFPFWTIYLFLIGAIISLIVLLIGEIKYFYRVINKVFKSNNYG